MLCSGQSFAMPARAAIVEEEAGLRLYEEVGACVASVHIRLADGEGARRSGSQRMLKTRPAWLRIVAHSSASHAHKVHR